MIALFTKYFQNLLGKLLLDFHLDVAMVSNYRDKKDTRRLKLVGFNDLKALPDVIPGLRLRWRGKTAQMFMISSTTSQVAGNAPQEDIDRACYQFEIAVDHVVARGAKVILFAANTKRLPVYEKLSAKYPDVIFTLGDNFTGLLIGQCIFEVFQLTKLDIPTASVLVTAPYGFLGEVALQYALKSGAKVTMMGNPERTAQLQELQDQYHVPYVTDFHAVAHRVDIVVACNSADWGSLTPSRVDTIRKEGRKLIVIDPSEPYAMPPEMYSACRKNVIRLDAGNGFSPQLTFSLEPLGYKLLRLAKGVIWGCFCESFLISSHEDLQNPEIDWMKINPENIQRVQKYYGRQDGQFCLPNPTCFNRPVKDFNLDLPETVQPG